MKTSPLTYFTDENGNAARNGQVYFYALGTLKPQETYADNNLSKKNPNPVPLDENASAVVFIDPSLEYSIELRTSNGKTVWIQDLRRNITEVLAEALTNLLERYLEVEQDANPEEHLEVVDASAALARFEREEK